MRTHLRHVLLLATCGLLAGCRDFSWEKLFFVEVEEEEVCKTDESLEIPGANVGTMEVTKVVPFDVPTSQFQPEETELVLQLIEATLSSPDDSSLLDGIEEAEVKVRPEGSTDPQQELVLLRYQRPPGSNGQPVTLRGEKVDVSTLAGSRLELFLHAKGMLPNEPWTVRFEACGYMRGRWNYGYRFSPFLP
jgi:hypothetical protein